MAKVEIIPAAEFNNAWRTSDPANPSAAFEVTVRDTSIHRSGPDFSMFEKAKEPSSVVIPMGSDLIDVGGGYQTDAASAARLEKAGLVTKPADAAAKQGQTLAPQTLEDGQKQVEQAATDYDSGADPVVSSHPMDAQIMQEMSEVPVGLLAPYVLASLKGNQSMMESTIKTIADVRSEAPDVMAWKVAKATELMNATVGKLIEERGLDPAKVWTYLSNNPDTTASALMRAVQSGKVRSAIAPLLNRAPR